MFIALQLEILEDIWFIHAIEMFQCSVRLGKLLWFGGWFGSLEQGARLTPAPATVFLQGWVLLSLRPCCCHPAIPALCAATHTPPLPHVHKCNICLCIAFPSLILKLLLSAFLPKQVCMHVANLYLTLSLTVWQNCRTTPHLQPCKETGPLKCWRVGDEVMNGR